MRINTPFFVCKLNTGFCEVSSFSRCEFRLGRHMYSVGSSCVAISFQDLFNVDPKPENVDDAVKFIHRCRQIDWPCQHHLNCVHRSPNFRISEKSVAVDVCSNILAPLCNEVILERTYREDLERIPHPPTLTYGDIGLGTTNTWHGTPDIRVRAGEVNFLYSEKGEGDAGSGSDAGSDARSDEESDGMTTVIEDKLFLRVASLPQVVAMNVVSSFTEHKLHPDKIAMVPSILINNHSFRVCLYHCERDILLISNEVSLSTGDHLSQSAMALLWAVLNHRHFLAEPPPSVDNYTAGIKSRLEQLDILQNFATLSDKTVNWSVAKEITLDHEDAPFTFLPKKKRRLQ